MAFEYRLMDLPFKSASAAITVYSAVQLSNSAAENVALPAATADLPRIIGFAQQAVTATAQSVPVRVLGISRAIAGASTTLGDLIGTSSAAAGQVGTATPAAGTTVIGWGLEAATAQADIFAVLVQPSQR